MSQIQFSTNDTSTWAERYGNGGDGPYTLSAPATYAPTKTTGYGTAAASVITVVSTAGFSAGDIIAIQQTRDSSLHGVWQLNSIASVGSGVLNLTYPLVSSFVDSGDDLCQIIKIPQYGDVNINSTLTLNSFSATAGGGFGVILSSTIIQGSSGILDGNGKGFQAGPADAGGGPGYARQGYSYIDNVVSYAKAANEGAGGGGERWAGGAAGGGGAGHSGTGTTGVTYGGADEAGIGGGSYGIANLTTIHQGSGGGAGGGDSDNPAAFTGGAGGAGGGIWILIAPEIDLTGITVRVNANNGQSMGTGGDHGGGGGGGSGGSVLVKGNNIVLGTSKATAAAGTGGTGSGAGGNGTTGRIAVFYASSVTGTTAPTYDSNQDDILIPLVAGTKNRFYFM